FLSLKDLYIVFMAVGSVLSFLAIFSFSIFDNSMNGASHQLTKNWLGFSGAYFADFSWQFLGVFSYVIPILLAFYAICGVFSYFNRYWSNSLFLLIVGFFQLLITCSHYQEIFGGGFRPISGALGVVMLHGLQALLDSYHAKEWLDECIFLIGLGGVLCVTFGFGITINHFKKLWNLLNRFANWIEDIFKTQSEYVLQSNSELAMGNNHAFTVSESSSSVSKDFAFEGGAFHSFDDQNQEVSGGNEILSVQDRDDLKNQKAKNLIKKLHMAPSTRSDGYMFPTVDLLDDTQQRKIVIEARELQNQADMLMGVLEEFGIKGEIENIRSGPVVTMYELKPAAGIKTSRVIGLADDIARSMSAISARIATIPGQNVIGIELPNQKRQTVYMRDLLLRDEFQKTSAGLPLVLGQDIVGVPIIADLARMPHLLVAGTTGSGKSVSVNAMILSILFRLSPDECRFIMIDPKMLELSVYNDIPHLLTPVVTEPKKAIVALKWAVKEMETRYRNMAKLGVRNVDGYNTRLKEAKEKGEIIARRVQTGFDPDTGQAIFENQVLDLKPLPYIVVVIDEMADLMIVAGKEVEAAVQRLAQMARAAGIHLIMATQRPSVDVITGTIKANFPTRISFQVTSKIDSRTILGDQGAEQLLGQGDMLYMSGVGRVVRVHGPFMKDTEVEAVVAFLKQQGEPSYVDDVTIDSEDMFLSNVDSNDGGDVIYSQAVELIKRENKVSTSFIQRHFQIGYNRAARIVEMMEKHGVVSPANHQGKREILVS
ncbi:MAG: DNA translocase FtsK 4TM domain-containing protein, partial [Alphaproteobacteria bacterium]